MVKLTEGEKNRLHSLGNIKSSQKNMGHSCGPGYGTWAQELKSPMKVPQNKQSSILFQHLQPYSWTINLFLRSVHLSIPPSHSLSVLQSWLMYLWAGILATYGSASALKPFFIKLPLSQSLHLRVHNWDANTDKQGVTHKDSHWTKNPNVHSLGVR